MTRRAAAGVASAAALIAAVTVVARVVGFGRWLVFSRTVGATCLGDVYNTANQLPNVLFEVVAGGALAGAVVPVLAGALARGDRDEAGRTASALLGWTLALLVPAAGLAALLARPIIGAFLDGSGSCGGAPAVDSGVRMLLVFAVQVPLYGVAVVLSGVLQADRRFLAPALAPLASSAVVVATYVAFGAVANGRQDDLRALPVRDQLLLALGTTVGVAVLAASVVVPLRRVGVRLRPTLRFPGGVARRARGLALAGLATLVAQQLALLVVIRLANDGAVAGTLTLYQYAWAVYLLPWAVLAVPIATSVFPRLTASIDAGDHAGWARGVASSTRAVLLASAVGAGVLGATADPLARVFVAGPGSGDPQPLRRALVAFAPGLLGYGLVALHGRALYAAGRGRLSAGSVVAGWAVVAVADLALVAVVRPARTVEALGTGNTLGMLVSGLLLTAGTATVAREALRGVGRAAAAAVVATVAAAVLGGLAAHALAPAASGVARDVAAVAVAALVAVAVVAGVALSVDRTGTRSLLEALSRG